METFSVFTKLFNSVENMLHFEEWIPFILATLQLLLDLVFQILQYTSTTAAYTIYLFVVKFSLIIAFLLPFNVQAKFRETSRTAIF